MRPGLLPGTRTVRSAVSGLVPEYLGAFNITLDYSDFFLDLDRFDYYEGTTLGTQPTPQLGEAQDVLMGARTPAGLRAGQEVPEGEALGAAAAKARIHRISDTPLGPSLCASHHAPHA